MEALVFREGCRYLNHCEDLVRKQRATQQNIDTYLSYALTTTNRVDLKRSHVLPHSPCLRGVHSVILLSVLTLHVPAVEHDIHDRRMSCTRCTEEVRRAPTTSDVDHDALCIAECGFQAILSYRSPESGSGVRTVYHASRAMRRWSEDRVLGVRELKFRDSSGFLACWRKLSFPSCNILRVFGTR